MTQPTFFALHALVAFLFGVSMILFAETLAPMYGVTFDATGAAMVRGYGSALLTFAAILWLARNSEASTALDAILLGFCVTLAIGALVAVYNQLNAPINALGWTIVALYAFLAAGHGHFYSLRQPRA